MPSASANKNKSAALSSKLAPRSAADEATAAVKAAVVFGARRRFPRPSGTSASTMPKVPGRQVKKQKLPATSANPVASHSSTSESSSSLLWLNRKRRTHSGSGKRRAEAAAAAAETAACSGSGVAVDYDADGPNKAMLNQQHETPLQPEPKARTQPRCGPAALAANNSSAAPSHRLSVQGASVSATTSSVFSMTSFKSGSVTDQVADNEKIQRKVSDESTSTDLTTVTSVLSSNLPQPLASDKLALLEQFTNRLRSQLFRRFRSLNLNYFDRNLNLVRVRKHPLQLSKEADRLEDIGYFKNQQCCDKKQIDTYLAKTVAWNMSKNKRTTVKKKKKGAAEPENLQPHYPDWITFRVRFKRENADKIWNGFLARRQKLAKLLGDRAPIVVKPTDKYHEHYIDVWTKSLTVQARPGSVLRDVLRPVFNRLGLDGGIDIKLTVECFDGDTRTEGKFNKKVVSNTGIQVFLVTSVAKLYEKGLTELYVNLSQQSQQLSHKLARNNQNDEQLIR